MSKSFNKHFAYSISALLISIVFNSIVRPSSRDTAIVSRLYIYTMYYDLLDFSF